MSNLKEMIRLSIIGFIALLVMGIVMSLYSCGSHKSAVMKETFVQREDSTKQSIDFGFTAIQDISNFFHSTTNRRINWKLYDTSKPVNPDTGKYPLLAEGNTEENNKIELMLYPQTVFLCNPIAHRLPGVRKTIGRNRRSRKTKRRCLNRFPV